VPNLLGVKPSVAQPRLLAAAITGRWSVNINAPANQINKDGFSGPGNRGFFMPYVFSSLDINS